MRIKANQLKAPAAGCRRRWLTEIPGSRQLVSRRDGQRPIAVPQSQTIQSSWYGSSGRPRCRTATSARTLSPLPGFTLMVRNRSEASAVFCNAQAMLGLASPHGVKSPLRCSSSAVFRITANGKLARSAISSSECIPSERLRIHSIAMLAAAAFLSPPTIP